MRNEELQKTVEKISIDLFGKPFKHKAYFNLRLRTTGGRYLLREHHIELNRKYYDELGHKELIGIIKHELCHYHLHLEGKGYRHKDQDFKSLMKKVDAPRHCAVLPSYNRSERKVEYRYRCEKCGLNYYRKKKMNTTKYVCGRCKGSIVFLGKK
ncbi:SprT family protein [Bacillus sp. 2205SS5-2]|uniref:SprT family protein n=1 Tax=Bacillus sp. 2205SS5-2 TaxID=3109031 RepID=UPI003006AD21